MHFKSVPPTVEHDRWALISEEGRWSIGIRSMIYGVRVSLMRQGDMAYCLDYCAGADPGFALALLATVVTILGKYPESVSPRQLESDFPEWKIRPISGCECWPKLQQMAEEVQIANKEVLGNG